MTEYNRITTTIALTLLALSTTWTGCARHGRHQAAEECYATPMHYGFHGTCWRQWPKDWVACREQEIETKWEPTLPKAGKKEAKSALKNPPQPPKLGKQSPSDLKKPKAAKKKPAPKVKKQSFRIAPPPLKRLRAERPKVTRSRPAKTRPRTASKIAIPPPSLSFQLGPRLVGRNKPRAVPATAKNTPSKTSSRKTQSIQRKAKRPSIKSFAAVPLTIEAAAKSKLSARLRRPSAELAPPLVRRKLSQVAPAKRKATAPIVRHAVKHAPAPILRNRPLVRKTAAPIITPKKLPLVTPRETPRKSAPIIDGATYHQKRVRKSASTDSRAKRVRIVRQKYKSRRRPVSQPTIRFEKTTQLVSRAPELLPTPKQRVVKSVKRVSKSLEPVKKKHQSPQIQPRRKTVSKSVRVKPTEPTEAPLATVNAPNFKASSTSKKEVVQLVAGPTSSPATTGLNLGKRIRNKIGPANVKVTTNGGTVTVRGRVSTRLEKQRLLAKIRATKGVQLILDGVKVN